jgi:hypothetical protein
LEREILDAVAKPKKDSFFSKPIKQLSTALHESRIQLVNT